MGFDSELLAALTAYGLTPGCATLVASKPTRPVWRVATADGAAYLKRLPYSQGRVSFVVGAWEHLNRRGAGVPKPLRTRTGELCAAVGQAHYILTEAAVGRTPEYERDLECIARGLASFHQGSLGYRPPGGSRLRDHTGAGLQAYREKIGLLRTAEAAISRTPVGRIPSSHAAQACEQAEEALSSVAAIYEQVKSDASRERCLCHQDFVPRNLRIDEGQRLAVFDLDWVAFDLPVRDLRLFVDKVMCSQGSWNAALVRRITDAYSALRPLSALDYTVLLADMRFPHLLVGMARQLFLEASTGRLEDKRHRRLEAIVALEGSKPPALEELAAAWGVAS